MDDVQVIGSFTEAANVRVQRMAVVMVAVVEKREGRSIIILINGNVNAWHQ